MKASSTQRSLSHGSRFLDIKNKKNNNYGSENLPFLFMRWRGFHFFWSIFLKEIFSTCWEYNIRPGTNAFLIMCSIAKTHYYTRKKNRDFVIQSLCNCHFFRWFSAFSVLFCILQQMLFEDNKQPSPVPSVMTKSSIMKSCSLNVFGKASEIIQPPSLHPPKKRCCVYSLVICSYSTHVR